MYVVSYDISSDRIRGKVAEALLGYGKRMQYSVFECDISQARCKELYEKLCKITLGAEECSIRFYSICDKCAGKIQVIGTQKEDKKYDRDEVIVI